MAHSLQLLILAISLGGTPAPKAAKPAATVSAMPDLILDGVGVKGFNFTLADLKALPPVTGSWKAHGTTHAVRGVALDALLSAHGFTPGPMGPDVPKGQKREGYKRVLVATARDGYQATFSLAELMPAMGPTRALVIWELDGKPLPSDSGPLRLVVLTDLEPSRSIFQLERLDVVDPRSLLPSLAR